MKGVAAITKTDLQTIPTYDSAWLLANGWTATAVGFRRGGTYGSAEINVALDTLTYTINDTLAATEQLADGVAVTETFTIAVTDGMSRTTGVVTFPIIGSNDAPRLTGTPATFAAGVEDITYLIPITSLTQGFTDPEGAAISTQNYLTSSGTVIDLGNGSIALTPGANYAGIVVLTYDVVDPVGGVFTTSVNLTFTPAIDAPIVKQFAITGNDLSFLNTQANVPIVTAVRYLTNGTPIYGYTDPVTKLPVELGQLGTFNLMTSPWAAFLPPVITTARRQRAATSFM